MLPKHLTRLLQKLIKAMISYSEALQKVLETATDFGKELVPLLKSNERILAEDIFADRDFPPFDRVTKDGIAVHSEALEKGIKSFKIEATFAAGNALGKLNNSENCVEIMTGAMLPANTDSVIMYEDLDIKNGIATLQNKVKPKINIHRKGSDTKKGVLILKENQQISGKEIGVLASVGKAEVLVKKLPKIAIISTGDELVEVSEKPLPHQIRKSNTLSLFAVLENQKITPTLLHIRDAKEIMLQEIRSAINTNDVLLLSGGVSKGKFDFLPEIFQELNVAKIFHLVNQRPGKPFWFGQQREKNVTVFSFPGNPVSTFVNYHIYFKTWLAKSLQLKTEKIEVFLQQKIEIDTFMTRYLLVTVHNSKGKLNAKLIDGNGSGDLISLSSADGVIIVPPQKSFSENNLVEFVQF